MTVASLPRVFGKHYLDTWFLLIMMGALLVVFWITQPAWLNSQTVQSLVTANAPLALVALAMTFSIIGATSTSPPGRWSRSSAW